MKNETNLVYINAIANCLLDKDIEETQVSFIASHPFTNTWTTCLMDDKANSYELVDLHNQEHAAKWRKYVRKEIGKTNLLGVFTMLNKPYRLNFLKLIADSLSNEDLGKILGHFWQTTEVISLDNSITGKDIISWFNRADKKTLMTDKERKIFDSLPEQITVYRGVTDYNKRKKKAFSWTIDKKVALWFANRFNTGTGEVWTMIVPKERVLCVFEGNEREIVINLYGNKDICKMIVEKV